MFFSQVTTPKTYYLVDNPKRLSWLASQLTNIEEFAFDIETNHPTTRKKDHELPKEFRENETICGISFAWGRAGVSKPWQPGVAAYVPLTRQDDSLWWGSRNDAALKVLEEILRCDAGKVAQHGKFDIKKIYQFWGVQVKNYNWDTECAHILLDEKREFCSHALKSTLANDGSVIKLGMSDYFLDNSASCFKEDLQAALKFYDPKWLRYSKVPVNILYPYACSDADYTLSLKFVFKDMLEKEGLNLVFNEVMLPLQKVLVLMELHGVPLDISTAKTVRNEQKAIMDEISVRVQELCGSEFNVGSNDQLGKVLFEELGLPGEKTEKGKWKVDADYLATLDHPVVEPLLKFSRAKQIHNNYAVASLDRVIEVTNDHTIGWVHTEFFSDLVTGRLRSTDPNLTTLPRPENGGLIVKSIYCAPDDYRIVFKDFSQMELKVAAHVSGEPSWVEGFRAGKDMHAFTAKAVFNLPCAVEEVDKLYKDKRTAAKVVNFGILYGKSVYSQAQELGISYDDADKLINQDYFGNAPVLKEWVDGTHEFVTTYGYVANIFGRKNRFSYAMTPIPESMQWPQRSIRPHCYRQGPSVSWLNVDPKEIFEWKLTSDTIKKIITQNKSKFYNSCKSCPYLQSCVTNREVKRCRSLVNRALRQSVNSVIQGSAADMASKALIWVTEEIMKEGVDACPILYIHDEIGVYVRANQVDQVCRIMDDCMVRRLEEFTQFSVPLSVDTEIVQRWSDKHKKKK